MTVIQPGIKYVPSTTVLFLGTTYICVNKECPSYKPTIDVPSKTTYSVQELIARAQREAESLTKTLDELNGVIGPFLRAIKKEDMP